MARRRLLVAQYDARPTALYPRCPWNRQGRSGRTRGTYTRRPWPLALVRGDTCAQSTYDGPSMRIVCRAIWLLGFRGASDTGGERGPYEARNRRNGRRRLEYARRLISLSTSTSLNIAQGRHTAEARNNGLAQARGRYVCRFCEEWAAPIISCGNLPPCRLNVVKLAESAICDSAPSGVSACPLSKPRDPITTIRSYEIAATCCLRRAALEVQILEFDKTRGLEVAAWGAARRVGHQALMRRPTVVTPRRNAPTPHRFGGESHLFSHGQQAPSPSSTEVRSASLSF